MGQGYTGTSLKWYDLYALNDPDRLTCIDECVVTCVALPARGVSHSILLIPGDRAIAFFQVRETLCALAEISRSGRKEMMASSSSGVFNAASHAVVVLLVVSVAAMLRAVAMLCMLGLTMLTAVALLLTVRSMADIDALMYS
jgi:hypothetical protein